MVLKLLPSQALNEKVTARKSPHLLLQTSVYFYKRDIFRFS